MHVCMHACMCVCMHFYNFYTHIQFYVQVWPILMPNSQIQEDTLTTHRSSTNVHAHTHPPKRTHTPHNFMSKFLTDSQIQEDTLTTHMGKTETCMHIHAQPPTHAHAHTILCPSFSYICAKFYIYEHVHGSVHAHTHPYTHTHTHIQFRSKFRPYLCEIPHPLEVGS